MFCFLQKEKKYKFKPWTKVTLGKKTWKGFFAMLKMHKMKPFIIEAEPWDESEFHCCGEIIKGKYEFMAAPLAGRGYILEQCTKCKKTKMSLSWMS